MNERIERLADRAEHYAKQQAGSDWEVEVPYSQKVFRQKFAELIVLECAHLVGGYTKENEFGTDVKEAYEEITKHFGVEE